MTPSEWADHVAAAMKPYDTDPRYNIRVSHPMPLVPNLPPHLAEPLVVFVGWYAVDPEVGALNGGEYGYATRFLEVDEEFDAATLAVELLVNFVDLIEDVTTVRS